MDIKLHIKLPKAPENTYTFDIDLDPQKAEYPQGQDNKKLPKTELGAIQRPDADRLKILKHPELAAEDKATEKVMDSLEL